jgi:uncharacterized protein (TIGR00369 family)
MTPSPDVFAAVPVNRFLGFELESHDGRTARVSFRPRDEHAQEYGVVHGGIISALADTAAVYTIHPALTAAERMTSIEFKINFLAGATADRGRVVAEARLVRKGRTVAVVQVDVRQGDTHVATGIFTYIILRPTTPG